MKKIGMILALVTFASLAASAKNINFTLDGSCEAFELTLSGTPKVYLDGIHDYSQCGLPNVLVGGFAHTIPTMGAFLDLMDPTYGYIEGLPYGLQMLTNANTNQPCIWAYYLDSAAGYDVLINSGTCTYFSSAKKRADARGLPVAYKRTGK